MLLNVYPYGKDIIKKKLECILHVVKRVFKSANEARKVLVQKKKTLRQDENKNILTKKNHCKKNHHKVSAVKTQQLTKKLMKELPNYYSLAVQKNKKYIENMRNKIWTGFYHKILTDANP